MSFPFVQPYFGLGNSLQTAQATGGAVGGWVELGRTTLGSAGDTIDVTSLPDKRYYMVLTDIIASGTVGIRHRLGNSSIDTGSNYAIRSSYNGGADGSWASQDYMYGSAGSTSVGMFNIEYIANKSDKEKLQQNWNLVNSATGAGTAPDRSENVGKWANTSNVIDTLRQYNALGGDFNTGSEVVVLGWDPADTHTTNFWEELASVEETGGGTATFSTGTFTAKKYLWVQGFLKFAGNDPNLRLRMGNTTTDSGSNYSWRSSTDGGADATGTSQVAITPAPSMDQSAFINMFIINNTGNEKLVTGHIIGNDVTGAGTAPNRSEFAGKWANTSSQANIIDVTKTVGDNYQDGSLWKVWGAN